MPNQSKGRSAVKLADHANVVLSSDGFRDLDQRSFSVPRLKIVQDRSQVLQQGSPEFDPEVKLGQFHCSSLNFSADSITVRVLKIEHVINIWSPPIKGQAWGTLVSVEPISKLAELTDRISDNGQPLDKVGNSLKQTLNYTILDVERGATMLFPMSGTAIRVGRDWNTRMNSLRINPKTLQPDPRGSSGAASWTGVWRLTPQKTAGGWYNIGSSPELVRTFDSTDPLEIPNLLDIVARVSGNPSASGSNDSTPRIPEKVNNENPRIPEESGARVNDSSDDAVIEETDLF